MQELQTDEHGKLAVPSAYRSAWNEYVNPDADDECNPDDEYGNVYDDRDEE